MDRKTQGRSLAYLAAVGLLAIVSLALTACSTSSAAEPERAAQTVPSLTVRVAPVREGQLSKSVSYTGDVKAKAQVSLLPKVAERIAEMRVDVGSEVQPGAVVAVLEQEALAAQVRQAEAVLAAAKAKLETVEAGGRPEAVAQAQANLDAARQRLATLTKGPRAELVAQAEANLRAAEPRLQQLKNGPTPEQRRAVQMNVEGAKVKAHAANVQKDGDCAPWKPEYLCQASQAAAIAAGYGIDAAQAQYDALVAPPTAEQLAQAQAAVDAAQEQYHLAQNPYTVQDIAQAADAVRVAEQQLKLAQRPFTAQDAEAARAAVAQATAALDLAKLQLAEAYVTAPIAGVIAERFAAAGSMASPQTPIATIASRELEVQVPVEDARAALVAPGQAATLAAGARPGQPLPAVVAGVAPTVDPRTRTVLVKISPTAPAPELKPGMFVQATIEVGADSGALLMPKEALVRRNGKEVAFVLRDGAALALPVRTGWSDERFVEVLDGLAAGDEVIVSGLADLIDGAAVAVEGR